MDSVDQVQRARIIAETTREIADLLSRAEQTEAKPSTLNPETAEFKPSSRQQEETNLSAMNDVDITDPHVPPTVSTLVYKLLDPPKNSFVASKDGTQSVKIPLVWLKKTLSEAHFEPNKALGRSIFRADSKVRTHRLAAGLPEAYHAFLCGENKDISNMTLWMREGDFQKVPTHLRKQRW